MTSTMGLQLASSVNMLRPLVLVGIAYAATAEIMSYYTSTSGLNLDELATPAIAIEDIDFTDKSSIQGIYHPSFGSYRSHSLVVHTHEEGALSGLSISLKSPVPASSPASFRSTGSATGKSPKHRRYPSFRMPASPPKQVPAYWTTTESDVINFNVTSPSPVLPSEGVENLPTPLIPSPCMSDKNPSSISSYAADLLSPGKESGRWYSHGSGAEESKRLTSNNALGLGLRHLSSNRTNDNTHLRVVSAMSIASSIFNNNIHIIAPPNSPMNPITCMPLYSLPPAALALDTAELDVCLSRATSDASSGNQQQETYAYSDDYDGSVTIGANKSDIDVHGAYDGLAMSPTATRYNESINTTTSAFRKIRRRLIHPFKLKTLKKHAMETCAAGDAALAAKITSPSPRSGEGCKNGSPTVFPSKINALRPAKSLRSVFRSSKASSY